MMSDDKREAGIGEFVSGGPRPVWIVEAAASRSGREPHWVCWQGETLGITNDRAKAARFEHEAGARNAALSIERRGQAYGTFVVRDRFTT